MERNLNHDPAASAVEATTDGSRRALLKGLGTIGALGALTGVGMTAASAAPAGALPRSRNATGAVFFVSIDGDTIGDFGGTERRNGRAVNEAFALQIDDVGSGAGAGAQRNRQVAFRMPVGLSTVLLTRAAEIGDRLRVVIDLIDDGGDAVLRFELADAVLGDLRTVVNEPSDGEPSSFGLFNEIELQPRTMSVEHVPTGTVIEV